MRRKLNKQILATTKAQEVETIIWDTEVPGLGLRITPAGAKSFLLKTRIGGGRSAPIRKPTLGKLGDLTLDQARSKARDWKVLAADGIDPGRFREQSGRTVADLCTEYLVVHAPRKRSGDDDIAKIEQHILPKLGRRPIKDLNFSDVERLHRSMKETPYAANRTVSLLSKMYSMAIRWEWADKNPAKGIERYPEQRRERFLSTEEIGRLTESFTELTRTSARPNETLKTVDALKLLMLTGARRSEVLGATWPMFDLEAGIWTKPSSHTKQQKLHRVPLSPPAIQLLRKIKVRGVNSEYVFPARRGSKHPHLTELKAAWGKACKIAGLEGVRIHDLRHTYASVLVNGGTTLPLIGALLGHTQVQTTHRYAHLADDPLREATTRVGEVVTPSSPGKIVKIGRV